MSGRRGLHYGWLLGVGALVALAVVVAVVVSTWGCSGSGGGVAAAGMFAAANPDVDPGSLAGDAPAPVFTLRDQQGRLASLAQFRGKVVVLAFVDARCTTICPLTTQSMVEARGLLGAAAARVQLVGIDANPLATRVADVAAYTRAHQMRGRWRFLTGSRRQLARVWRAYHVYVAAIHGNIDHEPVLFLLDGQGRERTIYWTRMSYEGVAQQAQLLADGIARLLPGHPAVRRLVSLRFVPPLTPAETVRLPALGPRRQTTVLGGTHPHLLVFFASWLRESSDLRAQLAALDRYAVGARRHGWPSPVAIDELATETSPQAAGRLLARFAVALRFPLVEDENGRLADGYRIFDLPWLALSSRAGRIVWHHDGWLPVSTIERRVRAALAAG